MIYREGAKYKCTPGGVRDIRGYCYGPVPVPCPGHSVIRHDKAHKWVSSVEHGDGIWVSQVKEILKPTIIIGI